MSSKKKHYAMFSVLVVITLLAVMPSVSVAKPLIFDTSPEPGFQGGAGNWQDKNWRNPGREDQFYPGNKDLNPVFETDATVTVKDEVAIGDDDGTATLTVNKGNVVLKGGSIRVKTVLLIHVAEGATLEIESAIVGARNCSPDIKYDHQQEWTLAQMGCFGLHKTGSGTLVLKGDNSYKGLTLCENGVLQIAKPQAVSKTLIGANRGIIELNFPVDQKFLEKYFISNTPGSMTLALGRDCASDLDFSRVSGLANASLGTIGKVTFSGKLTSARGVYRLGGGGGKLTVTTPIKSDKTLFIKHGKVVLAKGSTYANVVIENASLRVGDKVIPATPTSLRAESMAGNKIKLTWSDKAIDESGYVVEMSDSGDEWKEAAELSADATEVVLKTKPDRSLRYRVVALAGKQRSAVSNIADVDTKQVALQAPKMLHVFGGYKYIDVLWEDVNKTEVGHVVEHSTNGKKFKEITRVYGRTRTSAHIYMPKTQDNYLRVAAFGFDGKPGPWSEVMSAKTDKKADVQVDLLKRFGLLSKERRFDPSAPASLPKYSEDEKKKQREAGKKLHEDLLKNLASDSTYVIAPGVYRITDLFVIKDKKNFTIKAENVRLFYEGKKRGTLFRFAGCENGTLAGPMIIQQDVPHFSTGKVLKIDSSARTIDVEILPGYSTDFTARYKVWYPMTAKGYQVVRAIYIKAESLGGRKFRLHCRSGDKMVDDEIAYVAISTSVPDINPVYSHQGAPCRNMTFKDITGYGIMTGHYDNGLNSYVRYINYRILPQPGTSQLGCGQPGQYLLGNNGTLIMDGCEYQTGWDDGINACTLSGLATAQDSPNVVYFNRLIEPEIQTGDMLRFYSYVKLKFLAEARIEKIEKIDDLSIVNNGNFFFKSVHSARNDRKEGVKVTLDREVGNVVYAQVVNMDLGAQNIIVRNSYWRDMQPDAIMMQSAKNGLVANNLFFRNNGPAVHTQMNQFWQEGKWADSIVICNNVIWDNPTRFRANKANYKHSSIRVQASTETRFTGSVLKERFGAPMLKDYVIDGNRIYNSGWSGIRAANADGVEILRNLIVYPGYFDMPAEDTAGITLVGGKNITVKDNTIILNGSRVKQGIYIGDSVDRDTLIMKDNKIIEQQEVAPRPEFGK